jgi:predicted metalloprotease with PDZ domain
MKQKQVKAADRSHIQTKKNPPTTGFRYRNALYAMVLLVLFATPALAQTKYTVTIDLSKTTNDRVPVEIQTPKITRSEIAFHLPKIVPGTYAIHNYGSYVTNFRAVDKLGKALKTTHPDGNTWIISDATKLFRVMYEVEDSWDTPSIQEDIFEPAGTNIEKDTLFVLNTFGFVGYLAGHEGKPYSVRVNKPKGFYGSTSLMQTKQSNATTDFFETQNYHLLADAPIMYAKPDTTWLKVGNTKVLVSVFSPGKKFSSRNLAQDVKPILEANKNYLGGTLPVDKYAFIIYLSNSKTLTRYGALEHSQSCFSFLPESFSPEELSSVFRDVAAHEFFHIITPLNIHSEEIGNFNYIEPKMSKHLWLYEGLTEYAAHHAQVRADIIDLETYLERQTQKIKNARTIYNDSLPFTDLSLYTLEQHRDQYQNVYEKGALIGLCLDVKLLQLSGGKYGTRELMRDLAKTYGKNKSFKDDELFSKIVQLTYPQIGGFFKQHIEGIQPLPLEETFAAIGVTFNDKATRTTVQRNLSLGIGLGSDRKSLVVDNTDKASALAQRLGFQKGDIFMMLNGRPLSLETFQEVFGQYNAESKLGDSVTFIVKRKVSDTEEKEVTLKTDIREETEKYLLLEADANAGEAQRKLQQSWLGKK